MPIIDPQRVSPLWMSLLYQIMLESPVEITCLKYNISSKFLLFQLVLEFVAGLLQVFYIYFYFFSKEFRALTLPLITQEVYIDYVLQKLDLLHLYHTILFAPGLYTNTHIFTEPKALFHDFK